jgi:hypothetical protein
MNLRTKFCPQYGQNGFNQSQFAFPSFASNKAAEHDPESTQVGEVVLILSGFNSG